MIKKKYFVERTKVDKYKKENSDEKKDKKQKHMKMELGNRKSSKIISDKEVT